MRSRLLAMGLLAAAGILGLTGGAGATITSEASHGGLPLRATLLPENQVPPTASDGAGSALVTLNRGLGEVCWDIEVHDLTSPVILAHIHHGEAGTNGPVVVDFMEPVNGLSGCVNADPALITAIRQHPADYYVNVHTTMFPAGEVRGQLG